MSAQSHFNRQEKIIHECGWQWDPFYESSVSDGIPAIRAVYYFVCEFCMLHIRCRCPPTRTIVIKGFCNDGLPFVHCMGSGSLKCQCLKGRMGGSQIGRGTGCRRGSWSGCSCRSCLGSGSKSRCWEVEIVKGNNIGLIRYQPNN